MMQVNGTWIPRDCGEGLNIAVVCEKAGGFEETSISLNFSFIPYSTRSLVPQGYIIKAIVNKDGRVENTSVEMFTVRPTEARPDLRLAYEFDSSQTYTLGSVIQINFVLEHVTRSLSCATNVYIMVYLPKLFIIVSTNTSATVIETDYGVKILTSHFYPGMDPLRFNIDFVVTSDISIFKEKTTCKGTIFVSTVYNQTYVNGSDYAEDHVFETKNLITIDVSSSNYGLVERCTSPVALGMESGEIEDCQITSSEVPDTTAPPHHARLNIYNTAWKIYRQQGFDTHDIWLVIDLLRNATITSIATQGGFRYGTYDDFDGTVGSFQLLYGTKKGVYRIAMPRIQTDPHNRSYFEHAIHESSTVKHHDILPAIDASYVIFKLERYCSHYIASMRVELFGCYHAPVYSNEVCDTGITNSLKSELGVQQRGFMVVDGQLFVCDSIPTEIDYEDVAGTRLYYYFTSHNSLRSYCLQQGSDNRWSPTYDGLYKNTDGNWQRFFAWNQCCLQSAKNFTQPCE